MGIEMVNGFACRDCTDVVLAKKGIDPIKDKPSLLNDYLKAQKESYRPSDVRAVAPDEPHLGNGVDVFA